MAEFKKINYKPIITTMNRYNKSIDSIVVMSSVCIYIVCNYYLFYTLTIVI